MAARGKGAGRRKELQEAAALITRKPAWQRAGLTRAQRVIRFVESLPVTKGILAGRRLKLLPDQREFIEAIYGDLTPEGRRRKALAIKSAPKGSGKTGVTVGLALAHLMGPESEVRGEVLAAAVDGQQAEIIFQEMCAILDQMPELGVRQTLALTVPLPLVPAFTGPAIAGVTGIVLPRPPVIQVQTVELLDAARLATSIDPLGFYTFEGDDGLTRLAFQADYRWPLIAAGPAFIRVTYAAGYGEKGEDVDEGLRHAILMTVARLHESRGDAMLANLQDDPQIARMFAPYRVWTRG